MTILDDVKLGKLVAHTRFSLPFKQSAVLVSVLFLKKRGMGETFVILIRQLLP